MSIDKDCQVNLIVSECNTLELVLFSISELVGLC